MRTLTLISTLFLTTETDVNNEGIQGPVLPRRSQSSGNLPSMGFDLLPVNGGNIFKSLTIHINFNFILTTETATNNEEPLNLRRSPRNHGTKTFKHFF
jgi:hypothetical protein